MVSPFDLDAYFHMNNGRYLMIMDLGRLDLFLRNGLVRVSIKKRWQPIVSEVKINYRRVLPPFASFRLRTRILYWEGFSLFLEAVFKRSGEDLTRAVVKMVVLEPGRKKIPIHTVASEIGYKGESPPLPKELRSWKKR